MKRKKESLELLKLHSLNYLQFQIQLLGLSPKMRSIREFLLLQQTIRKAHFALTDTWCIRKDEYHINREWKDKPSFSLLHCKQSLVTKTYIETMKNHSHISTGLFLRAHL